MVPDAPLPDPVVGQISGQESAEAQQPNSSFPVVAIGASAGGLEAFTSLLQNLPVDTGMAFVIVQHLAPTHESMLVHLLSRATAMPVHQVEDGTILVPNQVFVIPPNATMSLSETKLVLKPRENAGTAVDIFLRSLAADQKGRAVAVILSGTGSDGALGVQAISEEGGVVFAQEPTSARFDGMPRSAIATGCVDFVLPPEEIASELVRIAHEPRLIQRNIPQVRQGFQDSPNDFDALLDLLRAGTGIDFGLYRQTTVQRRLQRRVALLKLRNSGDYLEYVRENPEELHALAQNILIRVTQFFRDPQAFDILSRNVLPALIRKTAREGAVRVWVPGCSTGEEAYSIAICFLEVAEQMQSQVPLRVFATDINESAIERARRGAYIENIAADVSPERLGRFFVRAGNEFQVSRRIRDLCIFSQHDLLKDPPFSQMGLVSCRNVLIYLDSMQEHAFTRFHFALNPGGFLLLGKSESAASYPELFARSDKEARLYTRQESAQHPIPQLTGGRKTAIVHPALSTLGSHPPRKLDLHRQADRVLVGRYGPPRVLVNGRLEVVGENGDLAANLASADGAENQNLLEEVKRLHPEVLKDLIRTAAETGQSSRLEQVRVGEGSSLREITLEVTPLGPDHRYFLIVFEPQMEAPSKVRRRKPLAKAEERKTEVRVSRLEKELASNRAHLESVIVEQEAANEEVVAANEELQSLNEELASSKEELEAANEELTTVNQELLVRNGELENAREFAQATIDTVRSSLLVLGPDLRVSKANRSFYRTFGLSPAETEHRFIYELGAGLFSIPKLRVLLEELLPANQVMNDFEVENESPSGGGRILLLNARRFESEERILLSVEDVTQNRRAEAGLRQSQKMEAVGYLAAGVAHDFNNLLTGVIGNASLLLEILPKKGQGRPVLTNIISSGQRAADLTKQLLAYAGKGRFYLERVSLSEVVMQTSQLMHPSIPQKVQLRLDLDKHLPLLLADPGQMQQVVMNLMINAVEAIGTAGGVVQVRTGQQTVTPDEPLRDYMLGENATPGEYVFIEVLDNGSGMDEPTIHRIFDPFFTTKFTGRGLGLAAVLGIVRQHKGALRVHSVPGRGSSFRLLLCATDRVASQADDHEIGEDLRGTGTVLIVDDEELIRDFTRMALASCGYSVLLAKDGEEGIQVYQGNSSEISLVLLDLAMPGMDGLETLDGLRAAGANVPVVVCSGLGELEVEARFAGKDVKGFLPKPYTVDQLARKVKECITPARTAP